MKSATAKKNIYFENYSILREFFFISDLQEIGNASFQKYQKLRRVIFQNYILDIIIYNFTALLNENERITE